MTRQIIDSVASPCRYTGTSNKSGELEPNRANSQHRQIFTLRMQPASQQCIDGRGRRPGDSEYQLYNCSGALQRNQHQKPPCRCTCSQRCYMLQRRVATYHGTPRCYIRAHTRITGITTAITTAQQPGKCHPTPAPVHNSPPFPTHCDPRAAAASDSYAQSSSN